MIVRLRLLSEKKSLHGSLMVIFFPYKVYILLVFRCIKVEFFFFVCLFYSLHFYLFGVLVKQLYTLLLYMER
jgi:hypothetical protein